ncbi:MAG: hypothetical protein ACP5SH_01145 [Syntrophobacteraceae bacterium]
MTLKVEAMRRAVAVCLPIFTNTGAACGSFYGNILQRRSVKTSFAFSSLPASFQSRIITILPF